jgi:hypothetical protein
MTKNHLTREENVQAVFDLKAGYTLGLADVEILKRVARMALAAMDSEPVAWVMLEDLADKDIVSTPAYPDINDAMEMTHGELEPLYRHAQQPVVITFEEWCKRTGNKPQGWVRDAMKEAYEGGAQSAPERYQVRREHAEWSQATFGNVGPVGPLKHLAKEAIEAAAEPDDLSEWADMQFLMWDAQRRAGITDEQITQAMIEKLAVNKQRSWPEPKDGEPRLHIKEQPRKKVDRCDVCTEGARGGCGTCAFNGNL